MMHRTRTIDYAIILSGEIDMLLDDTEVHLKAGDILVQQATNHAWVNRSKDVLPHLLRPDRRQGAAEMRRAIREGREMADARRRCLCLAACSLVTLTDPYGNRYGDWYNHGANYRWQMTTCEQEIVDTLGAQRRAQALHALLHVAPRRADRRCAELLGGLTAPCVRDCAAHLRAMSGTAPPASPRSFARTGVGILLGRTAFALPTGGRRLTLKNAHTGETFNGPYRDATGSLPSAVADLAVFLRDFHVDKTGPVDVGMLDFLADVMAATNQSGATVLSAYRTRETNERLKATNFGVAEQSQHIFGRAIDVTFDRDLRRRGAGGSRR